MNNKNRHSKIVARLTVAGFLAASVSGCTFMRPDETGPQIDVKKGYAIRRQLLDQFVVTAEIIAWPPACTQNLTLLGMPSRQILVALQTDWDGKKLTRRTTQFGAAPSETTYRSPIVSEEITALKKDCDAVVQENMPESMQGDTVLQNFKNRFVPVKVNGPS